MDLSEYFNSLNHTDDLRKEYYMNLSTIIAAAVIIVLVTLAARYLYKNGTCGSCPEHGACHGHCTTGKIKKDPLYKEKSEKIDEIIKKHGL